MLDFLAEHQEGLQVLHYVNGQEYKAHLDAFYDNYGQDKDTGGQRVLTMLMYLSTPEEGGETTFPNAGVVTCQDCSALQSDKLWLMGACNQEKWPKKWTNMLPGHCVV